MLKVKSINHSLYILEEFFQLKCEDEYVLHIWNVFKKIVKTGDYYSPTLIEILKTGLEKMCEKAGNDLSEEWIVCMRTYISNFEKRGIRIVETKNTRLLVEKRKV